MKTTILTLVLTLMTASAFAECKDQGKIGAAAESIFKKRDEAAASTIEFKGTTKKGDKDKFTVEVNVQEECITGVIVFMKKGTCKVINAFEYGQRDCG